MSSNPAHDGVYSIQHYVIKFVSDLWQVGDFHRVLRFPPPIRRSLRYQRGISESVYKNNRSDITEILLKVALNIIILTLNGQSTDNAMVKGKRIKGKTMRHKTLRNNLKIEQHEPHIKTGVKVV